ncbi:MULTISPECIES: acetate--CoA ligase [Burkholderiales]|uniref:acetate--CoA ligase n=1 Tax=Burkholderiales TaxID=80840 RepID=UPI002730597A|nr:MULTISPECIES: acetate--CoA ligase [Burkholderiales]MDP2449433.1 acetate--CoA ligase [Polaromonas sp.]MDP3188859.1 acetate--CoA ligase [Limnobacter sp.]MDP3754387.1 acetate--CoA ligase [Polaromonas sp.]
MERPEVIRKTARDLRVPPNLSSYDAECRDFSWDAARRALQGLPDGGLNIGFEAVDRHATGSLRDHIALRFVARNTPPLDLRYGDLARQTNRFANVLQGLGVGKGDHLFVMAGRIPALYITVLGALKNGTVVTPMFSAFGPEPMATRINIGAGQVLVTTDLIYQRKVRAMRGKMPTLHHVLLVSEDGGITNEPDTLDLATLMRNASDVFTTVATQPEDPALLHFTSGTTGTPKGALHVHGAVVAHHATGLYALDLHPGDRYWCTADPGWVTGTSYGIIAPLLHGVTSLIDREEFDAGRWYSLLEQERISVWYTAPTAIRMLMKSGLEAAQTHRFPDLRFVASVGEPLNPEAVWWGKQALGLPIHDNWWQTETGGIMIANTPAFDIKPGSMGRPLPGIKACIVEHLEAEGEPPRVRVIDTPDVEGELALKAGWPSMFRGYLNNEARYRKCFAGDLYLTGDLARVDADGYYWFVGRSDDVIKSAGHLIGPFEVESVLMEHPAVAEAGVIGKPDPVVGEVVKAFVSLKDGHAPDEALRMDILAHARKRLGAAVAPKEIAFLTVLPRTRSGKIMRRLLKARELGLPEGDTSTLEGGA